MKFKTVADLKAYFENLDKTNEYQVGPVCSNHSRTVFQIGIAQVLMDTVMPFNFLMPSRVWYWTNYSMTNKQALVDAAKYNARVEEEYYAEEGDDAFQLIFDKADDLLQWLFDTKLKDLTLVTEKAA
jgi:hypothetical protein